MDIVANIIRNLAKDITIQLNPSLVTFQRDGRMIQSNPTLFINKDINKPQVLGWGQSYSGREEYIKLDVFDFKNVAKYSYLKPMDCLIAFFRFGFREVVNKNYFLRPKVLVYGIYSLEGNFPKEAKAIIEEALLKSGATECEFE